MKEKNQNMDAQARAWDKLGRKSFAARFKLLRNIGADKHQTAGGQKFSLAAAAMQNYANLPSAIKRILNQAFDGEKFGPKVQEQNLRELDCDTLECTRILCQLAR